MNTPFPHATEAEPTRPTWRCFHCNILFTDPISAARHFGERKNDAPLCRVDKLAFDLARRERNEAQDALGAARARIEELERQVRDLRNAMNETVTNGTWTDGEQRGDWCISKEVYDTACEARDEVDSRISPNG